MPLRKRYTKKIIPPHQIRRMIERFLKEAGPGIRLFTEMSENIPNVALTIKNGEGRIIFTNHYNAAISGWSSPDEMIGYTSEELYPPDQAAVYAGRDRQVYETGEPIVERIYGFVADRSSDCNCVTVRPVLGLSGKRIGTATIYYRAEKKMSAVNWYDPIRKSIAYLNDHYNEPVTVEELAAISNYSVAQFRKLFARLAQMSPSAYITQVRVNAARTLLTTTDKRIADIAVATGFCDHSHFIKTFRKHTGKSPSAFRHGLA